MSWNDFLGGDQVGSADPLDILRSLAGSAPPQNMAGGAVTKLPNLPASTMPNKPVPGPIENAVTPGGGLDVRALLEQMGPLIASAALHQPGQRTGFLNGYMQGQQLGAAEREKKQAASQAKNQAAANFMLEVGQHALAIDDPVQRSQFLDLVQNTGETAGLLQPNDPRVAKLRDVPASQVAQKRLKELVDQLGSLEKNGYNLDDLSKSGAHVRLKDGTDVPVSTALQLTNVQPFDAGNKPVTKPAKDKRGFTKVDALVTGADGKATRQEVNFDADTGKYSDPDTGAVIPSKSIQKYEKPATVDPAGPAAQLGSLVSIWKESHPGQPVPENVMSQLRKQANQVNDKPAATGPALGGLDEDGLDYAATIFRLTNRMPPQGRQSNGAYQAITNRAAAQAKGLGQSPVAVIQKQLALKADGAALTRLSTMASAADAFESKALAQADIVDGLSQKVSRTQYPIINDGLLAGKARITGDANTQLLYNALTTFTTEYAKIMSGATGSSGASSDSSRREAASLISASLNKGTLSQTLDLMRKEMRLTMQGYDVAKQHVSDNMGGGARPSAAAPSGAFKVGSFSVTVDP